MKGARRSQSIEFTPIQIIKQSHLDKTSDFFARYGGKTIIIARFVPIIRTFAPFAAGSGAMN